jgi:hypothetical protein
MPCGAPLRNLAVGLIRRSGWTNIAAADTGCGERCIIIPPITPSDEAGTWKIPGAPDRHLPTWLVAVTARILKGRSSMSNRICSSRLR